MDLRLMPCGSFALVFRPETTDLCDVPDGKYIVNPTRIGRYFGVIYPLNRNYQPDVICSAPERIPKSMVESLSALDTFENLPDDFLVNYRTYLTKNGVVVANYLVESIRDILNSPTGSTIAALNEKGINQYAGQTLAGTAALIGLSALRKAAINAATLSDAGAKVLSKLDAPLQEAALTFAREDLNIFYEEAYQAFDGQTQLAIQDYSDPDEKQAFNSDIQYVKSCIVRCKDMLGITS